VSPDWPRVSKNERHGYEEPERAAAPPPAPESAQQFHKEWRAQGMHLSDSRRDFFMEMEAYANRRAAHLQAEVEQQKEWSRKLAQDADKVAADLRAAEARRRVLEEALAQSVSLQSHYAMLLNGWDGGDRLQFKDFEEWIARLRALAPGQEEK